MVQADPAHRKVSVFPERETVRDRGYQDRKLRACGVDPARYGDLAETGLFGQDCFKQMTAAGQLLDGMVHMGQRFILHAPVALDELLSQFGWIESNVEHPRGRRIVQKFEFRRSSGELAVSAEMYRLKPDRSKMGVRCGGGAAREDPREGLSQLETKAMCPEAVVAFSEDVGNLIHFEPSFAARYGYRAPISQGIQTMIWMMGALALSSPPRRFDVTARFARPVFWDETVELWGGDGLYRVLNRGGKPAVELRVHDVEY